MMRHKIIIILSVTTMLSGCAELFLQPYGQVTPDAGNVSVAKVILPDNAPTISQGYNPHPELNSEAISGAGHEGIDIYAETGTPVIAPASGIITGSHFEPFYGNKITIDHGKDENGVSIQSRFLHLDQRYVNKGDEVSRGRQIGTLGSSGILASYPHLHFEVRLGQDRESGNPHRYWINGPGNVTCFDKDKQYPDRPFRTTYPVVCKNR